MTTVDRDADHYMILLDPAGPMVTYSDGILFIDDLNPEAHIRWSISSRELRGMGWRMLYAALREGAREHLAVILGSRHGGHQ